MRFDGFVHILVNKDRKGWIDALRGMAMLLVIYGHCIENVPAYYIFTSPVKMPMFFAISGYLMNVNRSVAVYAEQLCRKVIIPWFCLGLLSLLPMIPLKGWQFVGEGLFKMLSGELLWFMPCFVVAQTVHFFIRKWSRHALIIIGLSFICFFLGLTAHHHGILNFAMINRAFVVQPFFLIGYLFCAKESMFIGIKWSWLFLSLMAFLCLCMLSMLLFPNQSLDVHQNKYYNIPFCLLLIFFGCLLLLTVFRKADVQSRTMSFLGQNTLVLYILHGLFIGVLVKAATFAGWIIPINWETALIKTVWACLACGVLAIVLNRFFPEMVGRRRS